MPDGEAAISAAKELDPDLVLLGAGGEPADVAADATRRLAAEAPRQPRAACSATRTPSMSSTGRSTAGAAGYVRVDGRAERVDVTVRIALALIAYREVAQYERERALAAPALGRRARARRAARRLLA